MRTERIINVCIVLALVLFIAMPSMAGDQSVSGDVCTGYGPQAPRDIDNRSGENPRIFSIAPSCREMNLCNIHFHVNAEHKAKDFSIYAGDGEHGHGGGYQCVSSKSLTKEELKEPEQNNCAVSACKKNQGHILPQKLGRASY